jgi:hypothetical protein
MSHPAVAPVPFELVYDDGEPMVEQQGHLQDVRAAAERARADAAEAELKRLRALLGESGG